MPNIMSSVTNIGAMSANRYLAMNTDQVTKATEMLSSGSRVSNPAYDPASSAVGYSISARMGTLQQASSNVTQATAMLQMVTSVLGSSNQLISQMKALTAQANTGTLGASELAMLDQTYQQLLTQVDNNANINSRWNSTTLLNGGAGTVSVPSGNLSATFTTVGTAPSSTVAAATAANFLGLISGAVESVSVTTEGAPGNGANTAYTVSVQVGGQTFKATTIPANSAVVTLRSTTDSANSIAFTYAAATTGITSASTFQSALNGLFGLSVGVPATFQSSSINMAGTVTASVGGGVAAGTYALSYTPGTNSGTFRLSDGNNILTQTIASPTASVNGSVTFANGFSLALSGFNGTVATPQQTFVVAQGNNQTYSFQIGDKATDTVSATFNSATSSALGLAGTSVATASNAATASSAIDNALSQLSNAIANIGGVYSQLVVIGNNLQSSIQNQTAAKSTFTDTDVAKTMIDMQNAKGLQQIASTVFTQALQNSSFLSQMVQQGSQ